MQPAELYLKELLYKYDCVTIPGLGGFIMQPQTARIDREKGRIYPPSRFPSFNSLLNHDDGLLISTIARTEKVSYYDSGLFVNDFASDCKRRLSLGEKIKFEGIGELSSNPEGAVTFRPLKNANFLAAVYGMEPLNIYPVTRPKTQPRMTQKHADRKLQPSRSKQPASVRWTLALTVPVILFLIYGIIFPASIRNIYTNYSGIVYDFAYTRGSVPELAEPVKTYIEPITIVAPPVLSAPVQLTVQNSARFYIIGGCFLSEENAVKFLQELISRGFEAEKAGTNNSGQIRISYKSFADRPSALSYLQTIRNEENPSAWLLKY